jgi:hypothetical protein
MAENLDTHNRALAVNLDPKVYGTFAEIGAGQEVARWFLRVGGAAGTVAKTISAYDMKFSDEIYGKGTRYVSRDRLLSMLDREYALLRERLDEPRGADTRFFAFADTVAARNYAGTNECHGWMGTRFQPAPRSEPSQVLLHVNMLDPTNLQQQQALGILGVNLVHASFHECDSIDALLDGIFADLSLERLEVDVVELRGPAFARVDPRQLGEKLVRKEIARAVMFSDDAALVQPSELLRKRPLVVERGMFQSVAPLHQRMFDEATQKLRDEAKPERELLSIPELSITPVSGVEAPDAIETLRRLSDMFELKHPVLLTRFPEIYHLTRYLRRYTDEPIRFVVGASTLVKLFHEAQYADLLGGLLEALARLLADNVKIYVFPMEIEAFRLALDGAGIAFAPEKSSAEGLVTADTIQLDPPIRHLYHYLREANWIIGL